MVLLTDAANSCLDLNIPHQSLDAFLSRSEYAFLIMGEHGFSVEIKSKNHVSVIQLANEPRGVLIEGKLGEIQSINVKDDAVLIVQGENGTIRLDLSRRQLFELLGKDEPIRKRPWV